MTDTLATLATLPELEELQAYKGMYALCTVGKDGRLHATHYAVILIGGNSPIWGVWTVQGRFQRFLGSKAQIEKAYPKLVLRRRMATWRCTDVTDKSLETRRAELETLHGKRIRTTAVS